MSHARWKTEGWRKKKQAVQSPAVSTPLSQPAPGEPVGGHVRGCALLCTITFACYTVHRFPSNPVFMCGRGLCYTASWHLWENFRTEGRCHFKRNPFCLTSSSLSHCLDKDQKAVFVLLQPAGKARRGPSEGHGIQLERGGLPGWFEKARAGVWNRRGWKELHSVP